ncbi:terpene synthase [Ganoderma sinense ZZ0214-1]|uniref:Terpene synthase n=1 Tax=Ganoderma sinense ZZ0214-1 TaxID=1077348 RepID=A0A2G8SVC1_9APHY|nr:terpene synthase [Ganoderma sinense ZZ0214-1]
MFPKEAFHHPVIEELENAATHLIIIDNKTGDKPASRTSFLTTRDKPQATNIAISSLSPCIKYLLPDGPRLGRGLDNRITQGRPTPRFLENLPLVPSFGPAVDGAVHKYIAQLADIRWSFEWGRYIGDKGAQVEKTRTPPVFPKRARKTELRRELVEIPLVEELEGTFSGANGDVLVDGMARQG